MRIVSLCPSLTELVFRLGRGGWLVGVTKFCVEPADEVARLEKVGGTKDPRVERIVELAPDLVLLNREENRAEDAAQLEAAGVRLHTSLPRDVEGARALVAELGALLGRDTVAATLCAEIDDACAALDREVRARRPITFCYLIWRRPTMAADAGSYLSALLERAGGVNVLAAANADAAGYPTLEATDLARLDPERVLLSSEPFPFAAKHADELAEATGLPRERFVLVDGRELSWHGSRTATGLLEARRVLALEDRHCAAHTG
ncbi:corrinoid ABC transporter substrate-binding protein [Planctomycetes bacterium Pla163]|uniref:Corrinoid ABC transporter substrate-binding protein n=1 Tax=Rohdeia mirabilis TaxID=2528008 RepID=A0A518CYC3_9BACT|nr:corrinoid ABC transporter substrate-binding protein [Planctomycetes bacterium Pla163]